MTALAKIHVAKKQLGLNDDDYRAVLARVTGKSSSADMSEGERGAVLEEFRRLGFKPTLKGTRSGISGPGRASGAPRLLEGKYAKKLQALWIAGWNLGLVRDRRDSALLAFVKRQTGVDHVRFLRHESDAYKAIEALKGWLARDGGVDWTKDSTLPDFTQMDGYRIALAQWVKMEKRDGQAKGGFQQFCEQTSKTHITSIDQAGWIAVMNRLGQLVRDDKE